MEPMVSFQVSRKPTYLSPTSMALWRQNPDEFYMKYLAEKKPPKIPQNQAMSIGSSFDAYVKSYLYEKIFGKGNNPKFDLRALFEAQVEPHNRDWAWKNGEICFKAYESSGSLSDLVTELEGSIGDPRFETEVFGTVNGYREGVTLQIGGVPFLGKPDVYFINKKGARVILDWKVNGYCSKWGSSPVPGYIKCREYNKIPDCHKDAIPAIFKGIVINLAHFLEDVNGEWADQLSVYSWLCGEDIGSDFIAAIDQLCWRNGNCRVAQHRARIHSDYQFKIFANAQKLWDIIQSNWIFRELSESESAERCRLLELRVNELLQPQTDEDKLFNDLTRGDWY
jgi:hypothetical protein